jgi:hypothetical protein
MKFVLLAFLFLPAMAARPAAREPAAPATTPPDPLDALVADSPFGAPAGGGRAATPGAAGPLELRSVVFVDGAYQFSVFDQGTGKADWVKIGERGFPFVVRSFNQEHDSLTVEHQGRTVVLALQPARTAVAANTPPSSPPPLPGAARNNAGQPQGGQASGSGNAANPNAGPAPPAGSANANASEAQRLQNLADEIRRRRGAGPQLVLPKKN